ncbi:hypothetical protein H4S01_005038 [Coemansia sp. RSA 2610]|nr:hypothetical protein H4S01_005038 [Coemansia sp. RSA 2610]
MGSKPVLCTHFDTPEGRWALASEFTTEEAANQFAPHIGPKAGGDDLGAGASGSDSTPAPAPPSTAPAAAKLGTASTLMVSGGIMLGDSGAAAGAAAGKAHQLANRPTFAMLLRLAGDGHTGADISSSHGSEATTQAGGRGIRQGLLHLGKGGAAAAHGKGLVTKSTSAFVSRIITNENLARWMVDAQTVYVLFNAPRSFGVVGMQGGAGGDMQGETLARLDLASSTPLCYDVKRAGRGESRLDVVMGFVQGNLVWYDAISGKYARLNKNSGYAAAAMCVRWLPGSDNLFMVGMGDGAIMIMDRTKEEFSVPALAGGGGSGGRRYEAIDVFETAGAQRARSNPVAFWRVGSRAITSIEFSPDGQRVAATSEDGALRIIDYLNEALEDVYLSYFGGLTCCAWSDDGRYVAAGGKDDMLTVWSYYEQTIVARCQGHESWVRGVAFDPAGRGAAYRILSVGDDAKLLVWDFSLAALHRPRALGRAGTGGSLQGRQADGPHLRGRPGVREAQAGVVHSRMPQGAVAVLQPLAAEAIHDAPISSLQLSQDLLVTACRRGVVKVWRRPAIG